MPKLTLHPNLLKVLVSPQQILECPFFLVQEHHRIYKEQTDVGRTHIPISHPSPLPPTLKVRTTQREHLQRLEADPLILPARALHLGLFGGQRWRLGHSGGPAVAPNERPRLGGCSPTLLAFAPACALCRHVNLQQCCTSSSNFCALSADLPAMGECVALLLAPPPSTSRGESFSCCNLMGDKQWHGIIPARVLPDRPLFDGNRRRSK